MVDNEKMQAEQLDLNEILKVRREKLKELQQQNIDPFLTVKFDKTHNSKDIIEHFESMEGMKVGVAGRLMSKRTMGKASFFDLRDKYGKIQLYVKMDIVGIDSYEQVKKYDIGDIVGATGEVFKTHKGEISIKVNSINLLAKSLQPLPEKWHGLKDVDLRYRQRYVDLIVNPEVTDVFVKRSKIIKEIRIFLDNRNYLEVETPILNTIPGGAAARPFITHHNTLNIDMYLRIATELHLKRLIIGGMERVYEIGRIFRNEGMSVKHNPEFTTIELYEAYTDYIGMMDLAEHLISTVAKKVLATSRIIYQGTEIDLEEGFKRITMLDSIKDCTGVDFKPLTLEESFEQAQKLGAKLSPADAKGDIINKVFEEFVEKTLIQPTFIMDYPVEISPLAKRKADDSDYTERFELFIYGREMANAFSELNDPIDQKERLLRQASLREQGDLEANMMDEDFINALEYGMPPTGGMGIGIDRLVMLLTDSASIRDVLFFPTMKPRE